MILDQATIMGCRSKLKAIIYKYTDGQVNLELDKLFDSKLLMPANVPLARSMEGSNNLVDKPDDDNMDDQEVSSLQTSTKLRIWPRPKHEESPINLVAEQAEKSPESVRDSRKIKCPHCDHISIQFSSVEPINIMQHIKNEHSTNLDLKCPFCMEHAFKFKQNSPPSWLTANVSTYLFKVLQIHVREAHAHEGTWQTSEKENEIYHSSQEICGEFAKPQATATEHKNVDRGHMPPDQEKPGLSHPSYNYMVKEAIMAIRARKKVSACII